MEKRSTFAIGKNLKTLRALNQLTQAETASILHVCRTSYQGYESGLKTPGIDIMLSIAKTYDISLDLICEADSDRFMECLRCFSDTEENCNEVITIFSSLSPKGREEFLNKGRKLLQEDL